MARGGGPKYYAVANGRQTGVFGTWDECKSQVDGYARAAFKSFSTKAEADAFVSSRAALPRNDVPENRESRAQKPAASHNYVRAQPVHYTPVVERRAPQPVADYYPSSTYVAPQRSSRAPAAALAQTTRAPTPVTSRGGNVTNVYVDGSCLANGQGAHARGGYGGFYGNNDPRNFSEPLRPDERQTNNRGELKAAIHAIRQATESSSTNPLHIHTDSRYVIDGITKWIDGWRKKDYDKVENSDLWKELDATHQRQCAQYARISGGQPSDAVKFHHVKGHSGVYGNEQADKLAVQGSMAAAKLNKR
ncbi:ribonuclease H1, putative [Bodo saltans]|uniref:ribonuclease H n=1 Tax=Bodo saltans TaxID=75058 RepID=A0A0S4IX23_BODSA|nr:ribonuclease H1, putative [Bodo saltans]|eukprot:CUG35397.1 ribonuclease H1, putative [Bodo saltans]